MEKTNYKRSPASIDGRDLSEDWIYTDFPNGTELEKGSFHRYAFYYNDRLWETSWLYGGNVVVFRYADAETFDNRGKQQMFDHLEEMFSVCEEEDKYTDTNEPRLVHKSENRGDRIEVSFWWEERI